ncbi:MAG: hypothetical protein VB068_06375 [Petrimonas sp.]|nr:hypothetical protein [Petrimonas sp.]
MEIEKILSEIKTKVGQTSLSDKTLTDYINGNLPTEGIEPDEAYFDKHSGILKSLSGNFSHDVANQVNEFKKNYKPQPDKKDEPDKTDNELLKRLEKLEEEREKEKKAFAVNSLRSEVKSKAGELKVANKALWNDVAETITVKDDVTSETLLAEVKKTYEKKLKDYTGEGASPYDGGKRATQVSSEEAKDKREAFKKKMQAQGRLPKEE